MSSDLNLIPNLTNPAPLTTPLDTTIPLTSLQDYSNSKRSWWVLDDDANVSTFTTGLITATGGVNPDPNIGFQANNGTAMVFNFGSTINTSTIALQQEDTFVSTIFTTNSRTIPLAVDAYGAGKYATILGREVVFAETISASVPPVAGPYGSIRGEDNGNVSVNANNLTLNGVQTRFPAIPAQNVVGSPNNIGSPVFYRPILANVNDKALTYPNKMPIRLWKLFTPSSTGTRVQLLDGAGNPYQGADWICCVVGFSNVGADRTYGCACFIDPSDLTWYVQYDQAGGTGLVTILAISSALGINYGYDGSFP